MKKRLSRIIAIMLVLLMVICNQSYSSMASDTDNSISGETKTLSGENEAGYTEVATDSDAGIEVNNAVISEEDKNTDTEEDTEANDNSDEEINSDMKDIADESEMSEEGEDEKTYPLFVRSCSVDGVRITVTASEGAFPEGATLSVNKVTDSEKEQINQAVEAVREDSVSVAEAYTFDIKVLDENGTELQPANGQTVNVSFDMDEVSNQNLSTDIYHIPEENGSLVAEELSTSESGNTVTAVSGGFSYYTVEFTYKEKQYVMEGDSSVELTDILSYVGITKADGNAATDSDITAVSVSDESLFSASNESGEWIVTAHQAFHTDEWMKVTVDGVEYEIVVTDATTWYINQLVIGNVYTFESGDFFTNNAQWGAFVVKIDGNYAGGGSYYMSWNAGGNYLNHFEAGTYKVSNIYKSGGYVLELSTDITQPGEISFENTSISKVYGNSVFTNAVTNSGDGSVTYSSSNTAVATVDSSSGQVTIKGVGSATITATVTDTDNYTYATKTATYTLTVNKDNIRPSVTMTGWTYGGTANNPSVSGNSGNGSVSYEYYTNSGCTTKTTTANGASATGGKPSYAGTYWVKATIAATTNYNSGTAIKDFTISKKAITITAKPQTITYGNSITTGTGQVTTATLASGDSLSAVTLTTSTGNVTTSGTITPSAATIKNGSTDVTGNYNITYNTGTLTIDKANLTVTAKPKTIIYGDAPTNDGVTYSGFKGSDSASSLGGSLSYTYSYSRYGNVGNTYTITPGGLTSSNYNITFAAGTLTVNQKEVGLIWSDTSLTYNGSPQKPTANATGLVNGDVVEVTVTGEQTNAGDNYTATASVLTGDKAGNYKLPASNTQSFSINGASMSDEVSSTGYTGTYDAAEHNITVTAPSGATVKYRTTGSGDYDLAENPAFTDAGTHTVYYQVTKENYATVTGSATVQIDPIELTLNWSTDNTFTYNGLPQAPTASIEGVINSDDCTVSVSGAMTDYNADAYTATAVLNGTKAGNYTLPADKTTTFTIGRKDATVTAENQIITYGESIATGIDKVTITGLVNEDTLTAITLNPSTNDATTSGTITPVLATIKKDTTDVTNNYNITYTDGSLTINKKQITISSIVASDKTYDGTTNANLDYSGIDWAACGRVGSDNLTVSATGTFSDANIGTGKTVTISDLTLSGAKADNYELAENGQQTDTTADITTKAITITADNASRAYDGTALTKDSYSITSGALATGDSIESVTVTGSQMYVGESANVPGAAVIKNGSNEDVTANYNITYGNGTLTIAKKNLTITADSDTKVYDTTPLTKDSYTKTALAEGDAITSVTITGSQTAVGSSNNVPSAAKIENAAGEDVTTNYNITYSNGALKVTGKPVTITAGSDTKVYDGTALSKNTFTNTGLADGDRIESVTVTGSQTVAGESANVPSAAVIKNANGDDVTSNYSIIYVNGTLEVTGKSLTITAGSDTKVYDGTALSNNSFTNTGLANGDRIESVTVTGSQTVAGESANVPSEAVIKNENGDDVTASYDITYANGTLEVTNKAVTITADDAAKVYDGTPLTKESYTNSNLAAGDTIESVIITGSQTNAGESANIPSEAVIKNAANEDVTASYDITYENGTLEVTKKPVTIDGITAKEKTYDGTTDAELDYSDIDWSACGMVDGDELNVTATGTFDNSNAGTDKDVTITDIILGGESIDNYELADSGHQSLTAADIIKKEVTITALKQTVAVNGKIENSVDMAELSGVLDGHELAEITLISGSTAKTTTEGVITPGNAKIVDGDIDVTDNYDIAYIDGVMTVTKAESEVILDHGDDEAQMSVTEVEAPNLQDLAEEEAEEGRLVKVELSVKPVSENNVSRETVSAVKKTVESLFAFVDMASVKVEYLEIDLTKYVDNVKEGAISDAGMPLEIILTCDISITDNPVVIRNHEGAVEVFTRLSARSSGSFEDETYYVEGDKIYIYSQYFSDFAIAYSIEKTFNVSLDDGNGNIIRQIVSEGTKFTPPTDLTRDGYDFGGWYKDEAHTQKWDPDTDKITSDIKLYAKWEKKKETTIEETTTEPTTTDTSAAKVDTPATEASTVKSPTTGDQAKLGIVVMLMLGSGLAALYLALRKKMLK